MRPPSIQDQLRAAMEIRGFSEWELARRAELSTKWVSQAMRGADDVSVGILRRIAHALEFDLTLTPQQPEPPWFTDVEYVAWHGPTKDLAFVRDARVDQVLLVDDIELYVHPGQRDRWVPIKCFEPPFSERDDELERVLEELVRRIDCAPTRRQAERPDDTAI